MRNKNFYLDYYYTYIIPSIKNCIKYIRICLNNTSLNHQVKYWYNELKNRLLEKKECFYKIDSFNVNIQLDLFI